MSNLALACGDAVHLLYRAHHGWLHNWLRAKLGDSFDAADLAQDTFVRVLRHRHELDALREPRAYLTTIAKRLVLNLHRRRSLERAYLDALATLPEAHAPSPEQGLLMPPIGNTLYLMPPYVAGDAEIDRLVDGTLASLDAVATTRTLEDRDVALA